MFGKRLAELLSAQAEITLILAGRRQEPLVHLQGQLQAHTRAALEHQIIDLDDPDLGAVIAASQANIIVDTCGPFQHRDRVLPRLAIAQRAHYIDLADAVEAVAQVHELNAEALAADVLVTSGASSVPALSAAVIDAHQAQFSQLLHIDIGIAPGNRTERGLATVRSILSGAGKPHTQFQQGQKHTPPSWSSLCRHRYAEPVGNRWLAFCPVPDPVILPARYPGLQTLQFRAGLELRRMHFGLWLGACLVRMRLLSSLEPWSVLARRISEIWLRAGSDSGAMHVAMQGLDHNEKPLNLHWQLIAEQGDGPFVPTAAAATLVRKLSDGSCTVRGAQPCVGLMRLEEIQATLSAKSVRFMLQNRS